MLQLSESPVAIRRESWPFVVRVAQDRADLHKAATIRHQAYARHLPDFAQTLREPELADFAEGSHVLLVEAKSDRHAVGTLRIQSNRHHPLPVEGSVELPVWLAGRALAEMTRLAVEASDMGHLAKLAMFKACYQVCLAEAIDWAVVTARAPLDRMYEALLFRDVLADGQPVPMRHVGHLPHRVMALSISTARETYRRHGHPLYGPIAETEHPDLKIGRAFVEPERELRRA